MKRLSLFCLLSIVFCLNLHAQDLQALQQAAIQSNRELQSSRIAVKMAQEDRKQAFTNYFPTIQAMGGVFQGFHHLLQADIDMPMLSMLGMPAISISEIKKGALVNASAVQPIFAGGQIVNGNRLARLQEEIRQLQLQMSERDVSLQVARLYWQIVALKANIVTLDAADRQLSEVHKFTSDYVAAGLTTRNDILRVELKQQELASSRLQLQNGIALCEMTLQQLCGGPENVKSENVKSEEYRAASIDTLISHIGSDTSKLAEQTQTAALPQRGSGEGAFRIEALLSRKAVDAAALQVKVERGKYLPTAAIGIADMYYNMMAKNVNNGIVFATVSVPISDWWGGSHAIRKAKLAQQQAANDYADTVEKLSLDNQSAWNNVQESLAQIAIAEKSIASAEENLRMSMDQYKAGTLPLIDLLDAQTLRQQASDRLIEARANYQMRLAEYESKVNP